MTGSENLTATELHAAFRVAEQWLARNRDALNAINVYPVPDGDTGTNMLLTLRASLAASEQAASEAVGPYTQALSRGALLGARGNSGVILSQILRGFADELAADETLDGPRLCAALGRASRVAYDAVSAPVEGTMLTAIRETAEATQALSEPALATVLDEAVRAVDASVERTPGLLPRLREAGVVDAGAAGVAMLLQGLRYGYRGEQLPEPPPVAADGVVLDGVEHEGHGYCTEFVVLGTSLARDGLERTLTEAGGESVLVVGDPDALHVHVHMDDPGPALSAGAAAGALESVKVENMQTQHEQWAAGRDAAGTIDATAIPEYGLVVVAQGEGLAEALRDLGAGVVVNGGPTANPSCEELLQAAHRAATRHVFLVPNDGNVILTGELAMEEEPGFITLIPTVSVAAAFSATVAFVPDGEPAEIAQRMRDALVGTHCVEVTHATRDTSADGVVVRTGDAIVLVDGTLIASTTELEEAMLTGLAHVAGGAELVTVFLGAAVPEGAAERVETLIELAQPALAVEVVDGGQPYYPYILGVE